MSLSALLQNDSMNFSENQQGSGLLEKLQSQRESGRFCDVVLHVQGKRFYAHRSILAACSPYFDSVLKMHKAVREQLIVTCQNHQVFHLLLNYIYTGTVSIDKENVLELLRLANHFLVSKLKNYCAEYLERNLNLGNCLSVKEMAEKYAIPTLMKSASDYVQEHMKEVLQQSDVLSFPVTKLEDLLNDRSWTISHEFMLQLITKWVDHDVAQRHRDLPTLLTFLDFKNFDLTYLAAFVENERLYKENRQCLFYFLQCLEESGVRPPQYEEQYNELKEKFKSAVENVDDSSFMNIAIATAIEGVQSKVAKAPAPSDAGTENAAEPVTITPVKKRVKVEGDDEEDDDSDKGPSPSENGTNTMDIVSKYSPPSNSRASRPQRAAALRQRTEFMAIVAPKRKIREQEPPPQKQSEPAKQVVTSPYITTLSPATGRRGPGRPPKYSQARPPSPEVEIEEEDDYDDEMEIVDDEDIECCVEIKSEIDDDDISLEEEDDEDDDFYVPRYRSASMAIAQWREGIKCPHCVYVGFSSARLEQHVFRIHGKDVTYKCSKCEYTCKWNREYYRHMRNHFSGPPYNCESCEYTCDRIQFLLSHLMKHTDERPFRCGECKYTARTKSNLIVHMRCHTGERPYGCEHCEKRFSMKASLDMHIQSHRKDRPFLCETCGFATKYQSHLVSHMRIHSGDVYYCEFPKCNYSSPKRCQVNAHARTHTAVRSHICPTCGRGFVERSHLVRHERIHLNDKPFKCLECDYSSSRRDKLKEHVQKHHGENATAKAPYKPRRPRRQTFDPAIFPGRDEVLGPDHKLLMQASRRHHYSMMGPHHRSAQELYHFESSHGSPSKMGAADHLRHPALMHHHHAGLAYDRREEHGFVPRDHCGMMAPRERMMAVVPDSTLLGHPVGNSENQPPEHGRPPQPNDSVGNLSAFTSLF